MEVLALIVTGGIAGWIAAVLVRGAGYGLVINIVVGVIGGILGGKLFALLGLAGDGGWLLRLAMAVVGALVLLGLVNLVTLARRRAE